jgi:putative two-component system response regulator
MPHAQAMAHIRDGAGSHFDPQVVQALEACETDMITIAQRWSD